MKILQEKELYKTDLFVDLSRLSANLKNYRKGVHNKFYRKLIHMCRRGYGMVGWDFKKALDVVLY